VWRQRIALAVAASLMLAACKTAVRAGLSEREANQLIVALDRASIAASKEPESGARDRFRVDVAAADATHAIALLEAQGLPKREPPGFDQLYRDSGLLATPQEERARWTSATEAELARSLARMPGVLDARVHLALPDAERPLDSEAPEHKAAVLLQRARSSTPIDEAGVRSLIAAAIDGLPAERVTVVQVEADAPAAITPAFVHVGPIAVSRGSAPLLRTVLATALGLDLLMAIALVVLVRRARSSRRDV
jgi:type III secretion protein J